MFNKIKNRLKMIKQPQNIYESNYLLFIMLKYFFVFPLNVSFRDNRHILFFDKKRIIFPITIIILTTCGITDAFISILTLQSFKIYHLYAIFQDFTGANSIYVIYLSGFTVPQKLASYFSRIRSFEYLFPRNKDALTYKKMQTYHLLVAATILVYIFIFFHAKMFWYITPTLKLLMLLIQPIPFFNIVLVIYCHLSLVLIIKQRISLLKQNIKQYCKMYNSRADNFLQTGNKILDSLKVMVDLFDVMEDINSNFGILLSSALTSAFICITMNFYFCLTFWTQHTDTIDIAFIFFLEFVIILTIFIINCFLCYAVGTEVSSIFRMKIRPNILSFGINICI